MILEQINDSPKISVIVPVYNGEGFIGTCIQSILDQSFRDFELIVVDDGSTDGTYDICMHYAFEDPRVLVYTQTNQGASAARNLGLDKATGEFIAFCDADDKVEGEWLKRLYEHAYDGDLMISGYKTVLQKENGPLIRFAGVAEDDVYVDLVHAISELFKAKLLDHVWNKLFKRDIIEKYNIRFDPALRVFEDELFVVTYLKYVDIIITISDYSYVYNLPVNYETRFRDIDIKQFRKIVDQIDCIVGEHKRVQLPAVIHWYTVALENFVHHNSFEACEEYIRKLRIVNRRYKGNKIVGFILKLSSEKKIYKYLKK